MFVYAKSSQMLPSEHYIEAYLMIIEAKKYLLWGKLFICEIKFRNEYADWNYHNHMFINLSINCLFSIERWDFLFSSIYSWPYRRLCSSLLSLLYGLHVTLLSKRKLDGVKINWWTGSALNGKGDEFAFGFIYFEVPFIKPMLN